MNDKKWMEKAISLAKTSNNEIPVACIIVHNNTEIASAQNCREANNDPTGHAEIVALRKAALVLGNWRLNDCIVYVTLEPCPMCAEALVQSRVQRVVFGAYDPLAGAAGSFINLFVNRTNKKGLVLPEIIGGICDQECQQLLLDFFARQRHVNSHQI